MDVEVEDVLEVVELDVVVGTQSPPPHASQQLGTVPTHTLPPFGGRQRPGPLFTVQRSRPAAFVRQHATAPARPHVDFAAQRLTVPLHSSRSCSVATRTAITPDAQRTYAPWLAKLAQAQVASMSVRAAITAAVSPGWSPHAASATGASAASSTTAQANARLTRGDGIDR